MNYWEALAERQKDFTVNIEAIQNEIFACLESRRNELLNDESAKDNTYSFSRLNEKQEFILNKDDIIIDRELNIDDQKLWQ